MNEYKELATAVLLQAYYDYKDNIISKRMDEEAAIYLFKKIDDMWFQASGINREWYFEKTIPNVKRKKRNVIHGEKTKNNVQPR